MIFALFLGPWSDKAGRKFLIAFPFFGNCLTCLGFIANIYFFDQLYVEFLWIGEVVIKQQQLLHYRRHFQVVGAMFGYWTIFFLGVYGYVADNTSVESRCNIANITNKLCQKSTLGIKKLLGLWEYLSLTAATMPWLQLETISMD